MLIKKTEIERIVAAAGFMLKQENMKASVISVIASKVMKKWTVGHRCQAAAPSNEPMIWSSGKTTNKPPDGKNTLASSALKIPRDMTRMREKIAPASHFKSSSRRREMGRHK